jgi:DNA-binding NarL/FixJ family response regulator
MTLAFIDIDSFLHALTPREREIAQHISTGSSNTAIAENLSLEVTTIIHHVNGVYNKLITYLPFSCRYQHKRAYLAHILTAYKEREDA